MSKSNIEWTWLASENPAKNKNGDLTISCRDHTLTLEMKSFSEASKLIRIMEGICARSRAECIEQIALTMFNGISELRHQQ